jgi:sugar transferase (PEP-CTERM system associated)
MRALYLSLTRRSVVLIVFETMLILAAIAAATWIVTGETSGMALADGDGVLSVDGDGLLKAGLIALICQVCLYYSELYDFRAATDRRDLFISIVQALGGASVLLALVYFWAPDLMIGRGVFVLAAIMVGGLVLGWRIVFEWLMRRAGPRERLLLVGTGAAAVALAREMFDRRHDLGVDIVGFVDPDPSKVGTHVINPGIIGTIEDIPSIVRARNVDRVVVSLGDARGALPMNKLLEMKLDGVAFDHLASVYEELTGKIAVENLRPSWLIFSSGFRKSHVLQAAKRMIDLVGATVALIVATPLLLIVAAAVKWSSPGPVMYRQQRVGFQGRVFTVFKFRSMCANAEAMTGAVWAQQNDQRITRVGRVLRRTRIDELPQLLNVLRGEMSLVGPRPERPEFVSQLTKDIPFYGQRHVVKPGLTGWAQVCYTYGASVEDAMEKLQYDLYYIKNLSIALDIFIIISTIKTVLLSKGAR